MALHWVLATVVPEVWHWLMHPLNGNFQDVDVASVQHLLEQVCAVHAVKSVSSDRRILEMLRAIRVCLERIAEEIVEPQNADE